MTTYVVVSIAGGILWGILDGLINANPAAQRLYEIYKPDGRQREESGTSGAHPYRELADGVRVLRLPGWVNVRGSCRSASCGSSSPRSLAVPDSG